MKTKSKRFLNLATLCLALLGTTLLMEQPVKAAEISSVRNQSERVRDYHEDYKEGFEAGQKAGQRVDAPESPVKTDRFNPKSQDPNDGYGDGYFNGYCEAWYKSHPHGESSQKNRVEESTDSSQRKESQTPNEGENSLEKSTDGSQREGSQTPNEGENPTDDSTISGLLSEIVETLLGLVLSWFI
ncbi:hypothetical protein ACEN5R_04835 [Streptococcus pyogenes]|uniref:hypothetical protein n=1 Tax=Streptococcus pyogenes TaxID=1314 RepID=UPI00067B14B7|nr:hypothetical protein [Streptococcus pyogenes]UEN86229.1 hypothetical protein H7793_07460 [Streptococcus pyogenes]VGQ88555.1 hypothetical membrane associated protein [Streptococcus pyogenes]VGS50452.1 hypothetical membrane associated protein [Streptococcus pyogenes]VGS53398.1 hypothetical membrane associated protein [Streptococcus pyogenes]VGS84571.1 hypothetical membrane associated protein [Streptococcus pyogenes]